MKTIENCINALSRSLRTTGNPYTAKVSVAMESGLMRNFSVSLKCNSCEMARSRAESMVKHFFTGYYPDEEIRKIEVKEIRQQRDTLRYATRWKTCAM